MDHTLYNKIKYNVLAIQCDRIYNIHDQIKEIKSSIAKEYYMTWSTYWDLDIVSWKGTEINENCINTDPMLIAYYGSNKIYISNAAYPTVLYVKKLRPRNTK